MVGRSSLSTYPLWPVLLLILAFHGTEACGATYVSGPVSGTWTPGGSPYIATDTLEVLPGTSLDIEAGVEVLFDGHYPLFVYGRLSAAGSWQDSVTFAPFEPDSTWRGIRFIGAEDGCYLSFCRITRSTAAGTTSVAVSGGAIHSEDSSPVIANCRIEDCRMEGSAALRNGGGAIYCRGGTPEITSCRILRCIAETSCTSGGGAIYCWQTDIRITGNEIRDCWAHGVGGGIGGATSVVDISHNLIVDCEGWHSGGGIALTDTCTGVIFNNLIVNNVVPDVAGGGICVKDSDVDVRSCTVAHNHIDGQAGYGGGIYLRESPGEIVDCILWGNTIGDSADQIYPADLVTVSYCNVEGGYPGVGNLDSDPFFAVGPGDSSHNGYYLSATGAGQMVDSPCIDAGGRSAVEAGLDARTTRTDLAPDEGTVDMGFHYENLEIAAINIESHELCLMQNKPNPFRLQTAIRFALSDCRPLRLTVFDIAGRHVATLVDGRLPAGSHAVIWNGTGENGKRVAPGLYIYRLESDGLFETRKMVLMR